LAWLVKGLVVETTINAVQGVGHYASHPGELLDKVRAAGHGQVAAGGMASTGND
jgi:hypothetical protein